MQSLSRSTQCNLRGNIIPNQWYQKFTNSKGLPDSSLIFVLSEIVYWHRPRKVVDEETGVVEYCQKFSGDAWQTSYAHFERKFGFGREKTRRILVKLENKGIITREFRKLTLRGQEYNNRLFIHLSDDFLNGQEDVDDKDGNNQILESTNEKNIFKSLEDRSFFCSESDAPSPPIGELPSLVTEEIIDNKNKNIKDRSRKQKNFSQKQEGEDWSNFGEGKYLSEFYPLSLEDCRILQIASNRNFSLVTMNKILFDMANRLSDRVFTSKKAFMGYMSMAYAAENRVNNSAVSEVQSLNEGYLEQEDCKAVLPNNIWGKIREILIANYGKYIDYSWFAKLTEIINEQTKTITLQAPNDFIKDWIKNNYLEQIRELAKGFGFVVGISSGKEKASYNELVKKEYKPDLPTNVWGQIRSNLLAMGGFWEFEDKLKLTNLDATIDEANKVIKLVVPDSLDSEMLISCCWEEIKKAAAMLGFKVNLFNEQGKSLA